MKNLNLDLASILLVALVIKSIVDGGSFPVAIAVVAILANQAYKAHLARQKDHQSEAMDARLKSIEEDLGSVKSKLALTLGSNRMK